MARWMRPEEEMPIGGYVGDRLVMIVAEHVSPNKRINPRLVILIAAEHGWDSVDENFQGYGPEDGVLWTWEKDLCQIANALGLIE